MFLSKNKCFKSIITKMKKSKLSENIKNIGVVGSGQMGTGIAYVFAR
jgi:hypothetical protein